MVHCTIQTSFDNQLKKREDEGLVHPHVLVSKPAPGFEYIVIGPVFGSFHSLVRLLSELEKQGLITQTFKITQPNVFLILMVMLLMDRPIY